MKHFLFCRASVSPFLRWKYTDRVRRFYTSVTIPLLFLLFIWAIRSKRIRLKGGEKSSRDTIRAVYIGLKQVDIILLSHGLVDVRYLRQKWELYTIENGLACLALTYQLLHTSASQASQILPRNVGLFQRIFVSYLNGWFLRLWFCYASLMYYFQYPDNEIVNGRYMELS